ncbi:MAG: Coenzyme F420 hydrogenase/dehydrogenase, beta subunit C-terminal domain [Acidimicrobiales bacterium]
MVDDLDHGRRPVAVPGREHADTSRALAACPGHELGHGARPEEADPELWEGWGPVLEVWEGYATDPEIRFRGSSGGAATALALHGIEDAGMHGVLHIRQRTDVAYLNETVISTTRDELVAATGSRYAPASPGEALADVKAAPGPCVMLGKPCDIAGPARRWRSTRSSTRSSASRWRSSVPGRRTPGPRSRWRGRSGCPNGTTSRRSATGATGGRATPWCGAPMAGDRSRAPPPTRHHGEMLQQHRQWRCYVCIDHTGEFADVSVGDPWYREIEEGDPGRSLVIVRTERGRAAVAAAVAAGHLTLERVGSDILPGPNPTSSRPGAACGVASSRSASPGSAPRATPTWRASRSGAAT